MIGFSRGYSTDGNRKSAADVIMYITDEVEQISPNDVTNARNYIYETTDLNMPHVVVVAINTADSTAHATFDNMQSVDMDLAVFAIESYDMLNTTVVNGADYEVDRINNYVCGLLPQSLPMYCVPGQRTTTTAPPTVPPAAQCYAMDIIFVVDMSQSPNNGQLKRRDKKLVHQLGSDIKTRTVPFNYPQFIENFQNQKNILKNIIDTFPNGHYGPPVGAQFAEVSFYDTNTDFAFNLSSANTPSGYEVVIEKMLPYMGDTFIEVGLTAVRDKMLDASRGYRSNVPTIVLLFSDGNDNSASHPIPIAEQLIQKGVSIFALYNNAPDSSPNIELLRQITQNNSRVVPLDQYHTLRQSLYDIINHFIKTTGFNPCHRKHLQYEV
uniref:VWFA domain-containing protein n=1 Tax=Plectus sambesii TaxID=2011161 RepID=A0A914UHT5_9BILA